MPSEFAKRIIGMLTPSLGEFMATKKVDAACKMAGLEIGKVDESQKDLLSKSLELVCEPLGSSVAASIRQSVIEIPLAQ